MTSDGPDTHGHGPAPRPGRPKLATVAALAGVSGSTASLALRGSERVTPATRERVRAAAAELGYAGADPTARSLRSRRSGIVGVVVGERLLYAFRDPVALQVLEGLSEVLGPLGIGLLLLAGDTSRGGPAVEQLAQLPLDAAVFLSAGLPDDPALAHLRQRQVPVVVVEGPVADDLVLVGIADREGTAVLARHLRDLGHERAAVVALPLRLDGTRGPLDADRAAGHAYAQVRHRLDGARDVFGPLPVLETAGNAVEEGELAGRALLDVAPDVRPTTVLAQSDLLAAGVLQAARRLGLRVPEDVSVAGFDGVDLPWLAPVRLTTVEQPVAEKGRAAGRAVAAVLAGDRPDDLVLPVTLRLGTTTGPPPA